MKLRLSISLVVLLCGTVVAATATAGRADNSNLIRLQIGDAVDVLNTRVACFALKSGGKPGVACVIWSNKGNKPLVGSYGIGLAVDGTAVLNRVKADGSSSILFRGRRVPGLTPSHSATPGRSSRGLAALEKVYKVKVGEGFGLPAPNGTVLGCQVLNITSTSQAPIYRGIKVSCWIATEHNPVPNRYGVSVSDKMAGVFKFTATGAISPQGIVRRQPAG